MIIYDLRFTIYDLKIFFTEGNEENEDFLLQFHKNACQVSSAKTPESPGGNLAVQFLSD